MLQVYVPIVFFLQTYVVFKYFMLQVFYVLEVYSESHRGMTQAPGEGVQQAGGRLMGRAARLGVLRKGRACPHPGS
jgi:hypothetical protein